MALSCRALGLSLDQGVSTLLGRPHPDSALLEDLLRARSEAEVWTTRAGRLRATLEPIWFLMWEHETFALINRAHASTEPTPKPVASEASAGVSGPTPEIH